jgi:hypothetical protein
VARRRRRLIDDMSTTPDDNAPTSPRRTDNPPSPSEVLAIVLNWLRHYWDAPRHKAKWTEGATVVLTLLIAGAAIYSAWIFQGQLDEAHNALIQTQRAWVGPRQPIRIDFYNLGPPEIVARYTVFMKNFGPTVALNVIPIVSIAPGHDQLDQRMKSSCDVAEQFSTGKVMPGNDPIPGGRMGQTLFPTEERDIPYADSGPSDAKLTVMYIVGCIAYRDQFDIRHKTRFCFETPGLAKAFDPTSNALVHCNVYNDAY